MIGGGTKIIEQVAAKHRLAPKDVIGQDRRRKVVLARFEAIYRIRTELDYPFTKIARVLKRDHSTIINGFQRHIERLERCQAK